jgi:hypothetical protein
MSTAITEVERQHALAAYVRGLHALERAQAGDPNAAEEALTQLYACLEWATPETWPCLWAEAQIARADACALRRQGDPLENTRTALACYQAALPVYLNDLWRLAGLG